MSDVQASIPEGVAQLYPNMFQNIENYNKDHKNFLNKTLKIFDREIQFYMAYLDYISVLKALDSNFAPPKLLITNWVYSFMEALT